MDPAGAFVAQSYDATYVAALAIQKAGQAEKAAIKAALRDVSAAPGEVIGPGEWAKAKSVLSGGGDVNYEGASGPIDFNAAGDARGRIEVWDIADGRINTVENVSE